MRQEEERGKLITQLREQRLWTRERLAKEAGVSPTTIAQVEEARTRVRLGTIGKLATALEVDPQELLHPKKAPAPQPLDSKERRGAGEAAEGDLEAFRKAQEAVGELLRLSGIEPRYITMPHAQLAALYDAASLEEAQEITAALVAERRTLAERHPDAQLPGGKPTIALQLSILTAMAGMGRVTEREAAAAREAGEEERVRHIHKELDLAKQALADAA